MNQSGEQLKQIGMSQAEANNLAFTTEARKAAIKFCRRFGQVTADDVRDITDTLGLEPDSNYNCMGPVMRHAGLTIKGYTKSKRKPNHGRMMGIWVMK
jgi:hypothetical protein